MTEEKESRVKVDTVAVKAYNETQQWTAILKDGTTVTGTLAELRAYGKTSKQEPNPVKPDAAKQLGEHSELPDFSSELSH